MKNRFISLIMSVVLCVGLCAFPLGAYAETVAEKTDAEANGGETSHVISISIGYENFFFDGEMRSFDDNGTAPIIINDRTMIPIRAVVEAMGCEVGWDKDEKRVDVSRDEDVLSLYIGQGQMKTANGDEIALDSPPVIVNNRTLLPIRAVVEYFGGEVKWNANTRTIQILW